MKGSKRTIRKYVRRMKSRIHSKYSKQSSKLPPRHTPRRNLMMGIGGEFKSPMITPNYPAGHSKRSSKLKPRRTTRRNLMMGIGGAFQSPMITPNYPAGHSQYLNNHGSLSNTYSLGGPLSAGNSGLASPPPYQQVINANIPDNLNHNTLNSYGNIGSGSGFPSRGSF